MFESLIPQFPYIGGAENESTKYLVRPSMLIPLVRILQDEGVPARQVGQIIYEMAAAGVLLGEAKSPMAQNGIPDPAASLSQRLGVQVRRGRWRDL
jgi:hypothetical protein